MKAILSPAVWCDASTWATHAPRPVFAPALPRHRPCPCLPVHCPSPCLHRCTPEEVWAADIEPFDFDHGAPVADDPGTLLRFMRDAVLPPSPLHPGSLGSGSVFAGAGRRWYPVPLPPAFSYILSTAPTRSPGCRWFHPPLSTVFGGSCSSASTSVRAAFRAAGR